MQPKLFHGGFYAKVARNTLAKADENRDWRIYADFAQVLIGIARKLYATDDFGVALKQTASAFTPPPSIFIFHCSLGRSSANANAQSSFAH